MSIAEQAIAKLFQSGASININGIITNFLERIKMENGDEAHIAKVSGRANGYMVNVYRNPNRPNYRSLLKETNEDRLFPSLAEARRYIISLIAAAPSV